MSTSTAYAHPDELRTMFSAAMSEMYQKEVPLYSELLRLVRDVNEETMRKDPALRASLEQRSELGESRAPAGAPDFARLTT